MLAGTLEIALRADIARLSSDLNSGVGIVTRATKQMEQAAAAVKTAFASLGLGIGLQQTIALSDAYTKFAAQLKLASSGNREYAQSLDDVRRISTLAQAELGATGILYARVKNATAELGLSQQKVANITESVTLALKASGATTAESASAMLQLSQAFGSGVLRGQEFNAVNEAAPRLMKALADGIGVPVGQLRAMAEAGKITSEVMAGALPKALEDLRKEAAQVQTIGGAFTVLKNSVMEYVGATAQANGTVAAMSSALTLLANNLQLVMGMLLTITAVKFGNWLAANVVGLYAQVAASQAAAAATLAKAQANVIVTASEVALTTARMAELRASALAAEGNVALAITLNGLLPMQARAAVAAEAHAVALTGLAVAQRGASVAVGAGTVAMAALGGPIGLIITLLGVAATAWAFFGKSSADANKKALDTTNESAPEIIAALDKQIARLRERITLSKIQPGTAQDESPAVAAQANALARVNMLKMQHNTLTEKGIALSMTDHLAMIEAQGDYQQIEARIKAVKVAKDTLAVGDRTKVESEWMGKYATGAEKLAVELAKAKKEFNGLIPPEVERRIQEQFGKEGAAKAVAAMKKAEEERQRLLEAGLKEKERLRELDAKGWVAYIEAMEKADFDSLKEMEKNHDAHNKELAKLAADAFKAMADASQALEKAEQARVTSIDQGTDAINRQANELERQTIRLGLSKATVDELNRAEMLAAIATEELTLSTLTAAGADEQVVRAHEHRIAVLKRLATAQAAAMGKEAGIEGLQAQIKAAQDLATANEKAAQDTARAWQDAGASMARDLERAFGTTGAAMGGMLTAHTSAIAKQINLDSDYAAKRQAITIKSFTDSSTTEADLVKLRQSYDSKSLQSSMGMYGDMAGAAASFFDKQSTAYKVLHGIERAMFAAKLAMQVAQIAGNLAVGASGVQASTMQQAADGVLLLFKIALGIANQANGDPYSAPVRMAAMAGIMAGVAAIAGVGFSGGGGGGGSSGPAAGTAEQMQRDNGTGTVLGDASAKSASIENALKAIEKIDTLGLTYTKDMADSLRTIKDSIGNLAVAIFRNAGISAPNGDDYGVGSSGGWLFGKVKTEIIDAGIQITGTLSGILTNAAATLMQYTTVRETSTGWFGGLFGGGGTSDSVHSNPLDDKAAKQIGLLLTSMVDSVEAAAKALGIWTPQLREFLMSLPIDLKLSLEGLKGQELTDKINEFFSAIADRFALAAVPTIAGVAGGDPGFDAATFFDKFQRAGEGAFETLLRIATQFEVVTHTFAAMGMSMNLVGMAAIEATDDVVKFIGGLEQFQKLTADYFSKYFTPTEQHAATGAGLASSFAQAGVVMPTDTAGFRALVEGIDWTKEGAAELYATLMQLAPTFYDFVTQFVGLDGQLHTTAEALKQQKDLQEELDILTGARTADQIEYENALAAAITPANRALVEQIHTAKLAAVETERLNARAALSVQLLQAQGRSQEALNLQRLLDIQNMTAAQVAEYDYTQAMKVQIAQAQQLTDLKKTGAQLDIDLLRAQGAGQEAMAAQRTLDIQGMNAAAIAQYDYNQSVRESIATLNKTTEMQKSYNQLGVDLLRAQGDAEGAMRAQRDLDIVGMNATQIGLYDLTAARRAEIDIINKQKQGAQEKAGLDKELFDLTHSESEVIANNQRLKMLELEARERELHLVPGTLTGIQAQIDAQTNLNRATALAASNMAGFAAVMDRLHGTNKYSQQVAQFTATNTMAAVTAALPALGNFNSLLGLTNEQFAALTPANQALVLSALNAGAALTDLGAAAESGMASFFKSMQDAQDKAWADQLAKEKAVVEQGESLQKELDDLLMTSAELRAKERAEIDPTNLALFDRVRAIKDERAATELATKATETLTAMRKELFDLTHSEAEIALNNRQIKMEELALRETELKLAPGYLQTIQLQIDAQTDLNAAREKENALIAARASVQSQIDDLVDPAGAKGRERARALDDPANSGVGDLLTQLWALQDAAEATAKALEANKAMLDLESELFALQNDEVAVTARLRDIKQEELGAREAELGLAPWTLRSIQLKIDAEKDLAAARDKATEEEKARLETWATASGVVADMMKQRDDLSRTEAEMLANNRALKMAELAARETELNLNAGYLRGIQATIDALTDLNTVRAKEVELAKARTDVGRQIADLIDPSGAAGRKRAEELAAITDPVLRRMTIQLYELQGAADLLAASNAALLEITQERTSLQNELNALTDTAAEALDRQRTALHESNRELFDQIQLIKTEQAAATEAAEKARAEQEELNRRAEEYAASQLEIMADRASWQERLDALTLTRTDKQIARERDLAAVSDDATIYLIRQVHAQEDMAEAAKSATDAMSELVAQMDQLAALKDSIGASIQSIRQDAPGYDMAGYLTGQVTKAQAGLVAVENGTVAQRIKAGEKLQSAIVARYENEQSMFATRVAAEQSAYSASIAAQNQAVDAANRLNDAFRSVGEYAKSLLTSTAAVRNAYAATIAGAKAGDLEALGKVQSATDAYLEDARKNTRTKLEYDRVMGRVQGDLQGIAAKAGPTIEQVTADGFQISAGLQAEMNVSQLAAIVELEDLQTLTDHWQAEIQRHMEEQAIVFSGIGLNTEQIATNTQGLDVRIGEIIAKAVQAQTEANEALRAEVVELRKSNDRIADSSNKTAKTLDAVTSGDLNMSTVAG